MTIYAHRTMGEKCPICGKDISGQPEVFGYPNLCTACAEKEKELKAKHKDGRIIPPDQKTLF